MHVEKLIELAAAAAGGQNALARALGVPQGHVSDWRHGRKNCTPEQRADLAIAAGLDPLPEAIEGMLADTEGTPRGARLKAALGKFLAGVVATFALCQADDGAQAAVVFERTCSNVYYVN